MLYFNPLLLIIIILYSSYSFLFYKSLLNILLNLYYIFYQILLYLYKFYYKIFNKEGINKYGEELENKNGDYLKLKNKIDIRYVNYY